MNGRYKPGERLDSESELAQKFKAGRGAVREALKALSVIGLVRVMPGKGTFVNGRENFLTRPLSLGVKADTELRRLVEARELIEVELAGLAAERASADQVQSMEACLIRMRESTKPEQSEEYLEADLDFHFRVAAAADNFILSQFMTLIHNLTRQWMSESLSLPGVAEEALRQHRRIFAAIQSHKSARARKAMERHVMVMADRLVLLEEGSIKESKGDLEGAIANFKQAVDLSPKLPEAHQNLGVALLRKGDLDGAIAELHRAIELRSNYFDALYDLGLAHAQKGDLDSAILEFKEALKLNSDHPECNDDLGTAYAMKGDFDAAIQQFQRAVSLKPEFAKGHYHLGLALQKEGKLETARAAFTKAAELDPRYKTPQ
jgi:DNA-binding FadR family transcriptional regulator